MTLDLAWVVVGFIVGWISFFPSRTSRRSHGGALDGLSVVIPARNEERNIVQALRSLREVLGNEVEVIVADDRSSDRTAQLATDSGAVVIAVNEPPAGWTGKAYACWVGQQHVRGRYVMFLDADVRLGSGARDLVGSVLASLAHEPQTLVSVQPWHTPARFVEKFTMMFNLVSVMASRGCGVRASKHPLAFGPMMVCDVSEYRRLGGHSHDSVRGSVIEDVALGKLFNRGVVLLGSPSSVTFRMYDRGLGQIVEGFVKNLASGGSNASPLAVVGVAMWFVFLCSPIVIGIGWYVVCVAQVYVLSRVVGKFGIVHALIYPVHVVFFLAVLCASLWRRFVVRSVSWKGRSIKF
ncbi:MAG: glycosyltransferase [Ilumatobacteraceae bacterium]